MRPTTIPTNKVVQCLVHMSNPQHNPNVGHLAAYIHSYYRPISLAMDLYLKNQLQNQLDEFTM